VTTISTAPNSAASSRWQCTRSGEETGLARPCIPEFTECARTVHAASAGVPMCALCHPPAGLEKPMRLRNWPGALSSHANTVTLRARYTLPCVPAHANENETIRDVRRATNKSHEPSPVRGNRSSTDPYGETLLDAQVAEPMMFRQASSTSPRKKKRLIHSPSKVHKKCLTALAELRPEPQGRSSRITRC